MTWGNDVLMQVEGVGAFVRVVIPVHLTDSHSVTFGAWLGVPPEALRNAYDVWWEPGYKDLRLDGLLANRLPPWESETYGKPLAASVIDRDQAPYAVGSSDPFMQRVLTEEWPHQPVIDAVTRHEFD